MNFQEYHNALKLSFFHTRKPFTCIETNRVCSCSHLSSSGVQRLMSVSFLVFFFFWLSFFSLLAIVRNLSTCRCSLEQQMTATWGHTPSTRCTGSLEKLSPQLAKRSCFPAPKFSKFLCFLKTTCQPGRCRTRKRPCKRHMAHYSCRRCELTTAVEATLRRELPSFHHSLAFTRTTSVCDHVYFLTALYGANRVPFTLQHWLCRHT